MVTSLERQLSPSSIQEIDRDVSSKEAKEEAEDTVPGGNNHSPNENLNHVNQGFFLRKTSFKSKP